MTPDEYYREHPDELDEFEQEMLRLEEEREFELLERGIWEEEPTGGTYAAVG